MGWMEFTISMTRALVWPLIVFVSLLVLRKSLVKLIDRIRGVRHGDTEIDATGTEVEELKVSPPENPNRDLDRIVSYLAKGAHSFKWLRDKTGLEWDDDKFTEFVKNNSQYLQGVGIIHRGEAGERLPPRPGMRLREEVKKKLSAGELSLR